MQERVPEKGGNKTPGRMDFGRRYHPEMTMDLVRTDPEVQKKIERGQDILLRLPDAQVDEALAFLESLRRNNN